MDDIVAWLESLGLSEHAPQFVENRVDATVVAALTDQDLKDLGVTRIGDRRKLTMAIAERVAATATSQRTRADAADRTGASIRAVEAAPRPSAAERRHLTVMFCDLVGSTALAARLDPEDMREVVRAYQGVCAGVIAKYEGFVAQYLGDGIMAYFGYPAAHEDDAERAVRAGLDLIAAVDKLDTKAKVEVRIGIATGLVVVGDLIGEHAAKERAVTGETPNLAARLQGLAAPGSIVIGAATRRLLGGMFDLRDLGPQQVKGLDAPVQAFAVKGVRSFESRFEARAGGLTGFVGREEEGAHLLARKKLAWQGRGQCVLMSGEAGIGKSRLTAWLAEQLAADPHTRMRYQCTPHHKDSALYPAIAQLERAVAVDAGAPAGERLDKLEAVLALAGLDTRAIAPLFAALLAIPTGDRYPPLDMSPGQQRQRTLAAMLDQIEGLARQKPVLMVYEDAHWADATSLELLDMLVDRIARLPVLVVVTGRPEFSPAWAGRHNVTTLALTRLDRRHARAMVESVSGAALPAEVLDQIVAKTDGVPLFVEELTKTVLESGLLIEEGQSYRIAGPLPALAIPATLQDSLMARLDRSNPVKEIAQVGAAIGREFSYQLLVAVARMDEASVKIGLAKLEESELATRRGVPPEARYTFKHALVQDAAYECLLKTRRQVIHRRIAKALRDRFPAIAETEPEIIAHHFAQAGRSTQAIDWWTRAGHLASRRSANSEAIAHFRRAVNLAEDSFGDEGVRWARPTLMLAYANALIGVYGFPADETVDAFAQTERLAAQSNDVPTHFAAKWGTFTAAFSRGELQRAAQLGNEYMQMAREVGGPAELVVAYRMVGASAWARGNYAIGIRDLESSAALYDKSRDGPLARQYGGDSAAVARSYLAFALFPAGRSRDCEAISAEAVSIAKQSGHVNTIVYVHAMSGFVAAMRDDAQTAASYGQVVMEVASEHTIPYWAALGRFLVGWAGHRLEKTSGAVLEMRDAVRALGNRQGFLSPFRAALVAEAITERDPEAACDLLDHALAQSAEGGEIWFEAELHRLRARATLALSPESLPEAEGALRTALDVSRAQKAHTFELRASLDLARLYCDTGREREAVPLLQGALIGFTETPELPEIGEAQRLLASLG